MDEFRKHNPVGETLKSYLDAGLPGKVLSLALHQPTFFRSAPILYPKKLLGIVNWDYEQNNLNMRKHQAFLQSLEDVAVDDPWKFGFGDLMYKETKFSGLESQFSAIQSIWWYEDLTPVQQMALLTYDMIKAVCRKDGHTYLKETNIPTQFQYYLKGIGQEDKMPNESQRTSAMEFLIEHEIVRRQVKNAEERFHLMR